MSDTTGSPEEHADEPLEAALELSQRLGMLGARPITEVIAQASAFLVPLAEISPGSLVVDLGSGGGVPGLLIARRRRDLHVVLVDRRATRADHLQRLVLRLGLASNVSVIAADARVVGSLLPRPAAAVVARGFGPPASLLAAARPLLVASGMLVVTLPPSGAADPWTPELLSRHDWLRAPSGDPRVVVVRPTD